jgi:hypothetical protein
MANLIPIDDVSQDRVLDAVRAALQSGLNADALNDFIASVDWSGTDKRRPKIADALGQLEGWASQYSDGELTRSEYIARLLNCLPEDERAKRLFLDGGTITITVVRRADHPRQLRLARSGDQPQTGSRTPAHLASGAPRSDTDLFASASTLPARQG